jgi:hypothetical protein
VRFTARHGDEPDFGGAIQTTHPFHRGDGDLDAAAMSASALSRMRA